MRVRAPWTTLYIVVIRYAPLFFIGVVDSLALVLLGLALLNERLVGAIWSRPARPGARSQPLQRRA